MKGILTLAGLGLIAGLAIGFYIPNLFALVTSQLATIPAHLQNVWAWLQSYGVTPIQLITALGGVATAASLIIAKLKSKLTETKQQADAQVYQTQAYANQQAGNYKATIEDQTKRITELEQQIANSTPKSSAEMQGLMDSLSESQQLVSAKTAELGKQRAIIDEQWQKIQDLQKRLEALTPKPIP